MKPTAQEFYDHPMPKREKTLIEKAIEYCKPDSWNFRQFFSDIWWGEGSYLLDVGCGNGRFLAHAAQEGFRTHGIEIVKSEADAAVERGIGCFYGYIEEFAPYWIKENKELFDIVVSFEVFEHLSDHLGFLKHIRSVMTPGGSLVLSVPYRDRTILFEDGDHPPGHLTRWNEQSLRNVLALAGFEVKVVARRSLSIMTLAWNIWHAPILVKIREKFGTVGEFVSHAIQIIAATAVWPYLRFVKKGYGRNIYVRAKKTYDTD